MKITPKKMEQYWGKHFGVGFMSSIGFKCKKHEDKEGWFHVTKTILRRGCPDYKRDEYLGEHKKSHFAELAMANGFNPKREMTGFDQPSNFAFVMEKDGPHNKSSVISETKTINKQSLIK